MSSVAPIRRSSPAATARWRGSPEWEAQANASSSGVIDSASAAPSAISGMAWKGLAAERQ